MMISTMEIGSTLPGFGSRDSGSRISPPISSGSSIGTARKNTEPHQKCSSRIPPITGPSTAPPENAAAQMAIAVRRSIGSLKMLRSRESVAGMSMAPKTPSRVRAAISCPASVAKAASPETRAKPTAPVSSTLRRPMRSPSEPMGTSRPARISG